jgi:demethoxyubiquinone hydroxylase (CLK1/Coq7/Cat5 family)
MEIEIYDAFKSAGLSDEKAHAVVDSIKKTINEHYALHSQQLATQGDVEKVRAEIAKAEANIIKWNIGAIIATAGLAMAITRMFLISN